MSVNGVNLQSIIQTADPRFGADVAAKTEGSAFGAIFDSFMGMVGEANRLENEANQWQLDFVTGKTDDMLAVTLAQEKAYTSLNFTVQVTNRLIEAYREILRIAM
jgi:flagellar hook-basal body complex protein FliE